MNNTEKIAVELLQLLIENHEDGDSLVRECNLKERLKNNLNLQPTTSDITEVVDFINDTFSNIIIHEGWIGKDAFSIILETSYKTEYPLSKLNLFINEIKKISFNKNIAQINGYDKFEKRQFVDFEQINFISKRYEMWSGGKMISSDFTSTIITITNLKEESFIENKIEVILKTSIDNSIIMNNFYFDVAYTNSDRILFGIIPQTSNCDDNNSYSGFVNYAPLKTRLHKAFKTNEPHACSLFLIQGNPDKITFSIALSKMLIEFYK